MESPLGSPRGFDLPTGLMKSPSDDFAVSRSTTQRLKGTLNEEPDHEAADESVVNGGAHDQNLFSSIQYISVSATILDDSAVIHQNHSSTLPLILLQSADKVGSDIMGLTQVRRNANQTCEKFTKACGRVRNLTIVVDDMGMTTEGKRAQFGSRQHSRYEGPDAVRQIRDVEAFDDLTRKHILFLDIFDDVFQSKPKTAQVHVAP